MTIGSFLRSWRLAEDLTQREIAENLSMSAAKLCDNEKGRKGVSPQKAAEIARILGYSEKVLVELALKELLEEAGLAWEVSLVKGARRMG
jgi:transcriptional regulator with XRE-family HTH domain